MDLFDPAGARRLEQPENLPAAVTTADGRARATQQSPLPGNANNFGLQYHPPQD